MKLHFLFHCKQNNFLSETYSSSYLPLLFVFTYKNTLRPSLQTTVSDITIITIYYIIHRSSCSIRSHSKFSNLTVLKRKVKFTLSYSFLSTKWVPVFHSKGKKPCKTDCNYVGGEGEHPRVSWWKTVVHFNISASLQQPIMMNVFTHLLEILHTSKSIIIW